MIYPRDLILSLKTGTPTLHFVLKARIRRRELNVIGGKGHAFQSYGGRKEGSAKITVIRARRGITFSFKIALTKPKNTLTPRLANLLEI